MNYKICSNFNQAIKFTTNLKDVNLEFFSPQGKALGSQEEKEFGETTDENK